MKNLILSVLAFSLIFIGCSQDHEPDISTVQNKKSDCLTLEQSFERARSILAGMPGTTRGSRSLSEVKSVTTIRAGVPTRSGEDSPLYYVVNFGEDNGFAMLSADTRNIPVVAMADEGVLDFADTVRNEGLKDFYHMALDAALNLPRDTSKYNIDPNRYVLDLVVGPHLSKDIRSIDQNLPYSTYCLTSTGEQAKVGCVALAASNIVLHFEHPGVIDGRIVDWDAIHTEFKCDALYHLLKDMGNKNLLKITYGEDASYGYTSDCVPVLRSLGFECSDYIKFESTLAQRWLLKNPIIIRGTGHAWNLDGYMRYGYRMDDLVGLPGETVPPKYYYHCVWGAGGYGDGYYYYWDDGMIGGDAELLDPDIPGSQYMPERRHLYIIGNFRISK